MKDGIFHYVRIHEAPEWERLGWCWCANLGHPHGHWSVLFRWICDCEPVFPARLHGGGGGMKFAYADPPYYGYAAKFYGDRHSMTIPSPAEQKHGNAVWTGANREKLEKLWSAGYSARLIAAEFPGTTRNAILGAVHRLKLPKRQVAVSAERAVYVRSKGKPRAVRSFKFKPIVCEPIEVPIPDTALRVSLLDRKDHQCCYPIEGMIYCGADKQAGSSYCPWHHRRVWVKPIKTRKVAEPRVKSFSEYEGAI